MESSKGNRTIEDVAATDPVMALAMALRIPKVPYGWTIQGIFQSTTDFEGIVEAYQEQPLAQRTWIEDVKFSIWLPNQFDGQVLTTLSTAMLLAQTGVLCQLWSYDAPKYIIAPFTPLETLFSTPFGGTRKSWMSGWRIERQGALKADLQLQQSPAGASDNVGPMTVNITFQGWQFFDPYIDEVTPEEATCVLRDSGYAVGPGVRECAQSVRRQNGLGRLPDFGYLDSGKKIAPFNR